MTHKAAATTSARTHRTPPPHGRPKEVRGPHDPMERYLEVLGLHPKATMDEVNTTYFTFIKRFPENPTEEDEARLQEVKHAYELLRKKYTPPTRKAIRLGLDRRAAVSIMAFASVALIGVLAYLNWGAIKMKMTHYDRGAVLRLKNHPETFGEVLSFDSMHRFPMGNPSPAYEIKLESTGQPIWVGEGLVVMGMERAK